MTDSVPQAAAQAPKPPVSLSAWPADEVERVPTVDLIPYARNARTHSDEQIAQIAASIREWGFTTPILRDEDGTVLAGHGRLLAAHRLKLETVPVITARGWDPAKKRAYVIADNKLALNAGWDYEMLSAELQSLDEEFDLSLVGFTEGEISNLLNADWNPPEEGALPEDETGKGSHGRSVHLTPEEAEVWDEALELWRKTNAGGKEGELLVALARGYLDDHG